MDNVIKVLKEFEGIIGTILGIVVGAIISHIQNNSGKIKVFFEQTDYTFDSSYSIHNIDENNVSKVIKYKVFHFKSEIEVYNSSNTKKILRNIKLCIEADNKKEYLDIYLKDDSVLSTLNIDSKSILSFSEVHSSFNEKNDEKNIFMSHKKKIYFSYKNEKGKRKKIKINKTFKT